jgi:hypothetical protein
VDLDAAFPSKFMHELSFEISVLCYLDDDESFSTQDRDIAAGFIPEDARPQIMPIVVGALEELVRQINAPWLYRVTKVRNPNEASMRKHDLITNMLENNGYVVIEAGYDRFTRWFWVMALGPRP